MIIQNIRQIDRLVEELMNDNSAFVSLDMTDREYAFFKRRHTALGAVLSEDGPLDESRGAAFAREAALFETRFARRLLLHIGTNDPESLYLDQVARLLEQLHSVLPDAEIAWEIGSGGRESRSGILLFALIGLDRPSGNPAEIE